jgi:acetolactate synthase-1/2/3 large subunit
MGSALPSAIAAGLVFPDRRILAIAGDGGFLMNVQEMETAKRLNSQIVVMVWEDGGYGLISWKQEQEFGRHTELEFSNPDWLELADAFGWHGRVIGASRELREALEDGFRERGPSLLIVPIDYRENLRLSERLGRLSQTMA